MFQWYKKAQACFAYLRDVDAEDCLGDPAGRKQFGASRWFTRGWTLQELLANPRTVIFYNSRWKGLGSASALSKLISDVTGIGLDYLTSKLDLISDVYGTDLDQLLSKPPLFPWSTERAAVAERMSWAAGRETARSEDMAYALIGLFEVSMPLLYGEGGHRAFRRLQLEILRQSSDESILAWDDPRAYEEKRWSTYSYTCSYPCLATDPSCFAKMSDVRRARFFDRPPYQMTNKGLQMQMYIQEAFPRRPGHPQIYISALNCCRGNTDSWLAILLVDHDGNFHRIGPLAELERPNPRMSLERLYTERQSKKYQKTVEIEAAMSSFEVPLRASDWEKHFQNSLRDPPSRFSIKPKHTVPFRLPYLEVREAQVWDD